MSIWIITTGNSDIILKHQRNWGNLYGEISHTLQGTAFSLSQKEPLDKSYGYTVSARILGLVYGNQPDYYSDLKFPLLDTYQQYFTSNAIKLEKIIVLLTDQDKIFNEEQKIYEKCPYWQDTCTIKPLLSKYFQDNFESQPEFLSLTPITKNKGIENWNETLTLVEETLQNVADNSFKTVYISHQAGTPAISSALQFVSLSKFKKVQFLVSNEFFDESYQQQSQAEAIETSNYWRGMQIQKAKQLILQGLPAAAKAILTGIANEQTITQLDQMVKCFNINDSLVKGQEFEIKAATSRIVTALDLIEIFFNQENYIQAVAILNACQETFLKASLLCQTKKLDNYPLNLSSMVGWNEKGLFIKAQTDFAKLPNLSNYLDVLQKLNFPVPNSGDFDFQFWDKYQNQQNYTFKLNNSRQFRWLCNLRTDFKAWKLLEWSCQYARESEDDLRNQLLHNLLGINQQEVRDYLLGYDKDAIKRFLGNINQQTNSSAKQVNEITQAYLNNVKFPLIKALQFFGLWREGISGNKLEAKLKDIADSLD